jgi:type IV pilus assembly protein PilC
MIFERLGGELPVFTQAFMKVYDVLRHQGLYVTAVVCATVGLLALLARTKGGHAVLSRTVLAIPLFGKLFSEAFVATFCQTIAVLLEAGVPVLETFDILRNMTKNDVIASAMTRVRQHITGGSNIALGMAAAGFFPNMVIKMTQVGEESGALSAILRKTSEHYERKVTSTIEAMTSLLEPVLITTIGAVVLVVVIALYLPIFTVSDVAH